MTARTPRTFDQFFTIIYNTDNSRNNIVQSMVDSLVGNNRLKDHNHVTFSSNTIHNLEHYRPDKRYTNTVMIFDTIQSLTLDMIKPYYDNGTSIILITQTINLRDNIIDSATEHIFTDKILHANFMYKYDILNAKILIKT